MIGLENQELKIKNMKQQIKDLETFQKSFNSVYNTEPTLLKEEDWKLRYKLSLEELDEYFYGFYTENDNERIKLIFRDIKESKSMDQWEGLIGECIQAYHNGLNHSQ